MSEHKIGKGTEDQPYANQNKSTRKVSLIKAQCAEFNCSLTQIYKCYISQVELTVIKVNR